MVDSTRLLTIQYLDRYGKLRLWSLSGVGSGAYNPRSLPLPLVILVAILTLSACEPIASPGSSTPRLLTGAEMDQITTGSATATSEAKADAGVRTAQALTSTSNIVSQASQPPLLNSAKSENVATATGDASAKISVTN